MTSEDLPIPEPGKGVAFIDGRFCAVADAKLSLLDWGFLRNDVCYDTVTTWNGAFFRLDDHLARFQRSAAGLRLTCPYSIEEVRRILMAVVAKSGIRSAYVQMILTRGRPPVGSRDPRLAECRFFAYAIPYVWIATPEVQQRGLKLIVSGVERIPTGSIDPTHKNFAWLDMQRALLDAYDRGGETVVLVDRDGFLTEGPGFNIFVVRGRRIATPDRGVLEGITRRTVLELCAAAGIQCEVRRVHPSELAEGEEIFISSSAGGIMPVTSVDGRPVDAGTPGPVTKELTQLYWSRREAGWHATPVDYAMA